MKLEPGWYKVRRQQYNAYGAKHPRANDNIIELLHVAKKGDRTIYYFDGDLHGMNPEEMNFLSEYEVVSKYVNEPTISECTITLRFKDSTGTIFAFSVRDAWSLRNLFEFIPWLRKPFGYVPRTKK